MPFDRSAPNRSFTPAPEPFVSAGEAAMRVVADADRWQQRRAAVWATEQAIRDALAAVGREVPADAVVVEAAEIMAGFASGWEDPHHEVPTAGGHLLRAYRRALEEAADPLKWAERLETDGKEQLRRAAYGLEAAKEKVGRIGTRAWEGKTDQLVTEACAHVRGAAEHHLRGMELLNAAADKRAEASGASLALEIAQ